MKSLKRSWIRAESLKFIVTALNGECTAWKLISFSVFFVIFQCKYLNILKSYLRYKMKIWNVAKFSVYLSQGNVLGVFSDPFGGYVLVLIINFWTFSQKMKLVSDKNTEEEHFFFHLIRRYSKSYFHILVKLSKTYWKCVKCLNSC